MTNSRTILYALSLILFLAPLFKGLFFVREMYIATIAVSLVFLIYLWEIRKQPITTAIRWGNLTLLDKGLLVYFLGYAVSVVTAVKMNTAVEMLIKIAAYAMTYIIVVALVGYVSNRRVILTSVYLSGVLVAVLGLGAYAGWDISGGFYANRISSTFQYPNTLGAFLAVIGVIGAYLAFTSKSIAARASLGAGNLLVFTALFGSDSRGAFLALGFSIIVFIALQPVEYRLNALKSIIMPLVFGGVTMYFLQGKAGQNVIWLYITGMICGAILLEYAASRLSSYEALRNKKNTGIAVLTVLLIGAVVALAVLKGNGFMTRILNTNFSDRNMIERLYFYKDAFKIIKDYPVLGTGGGGWASLYKAYQSYGYISRQVHNFYLQTVVETGLFGFAALLLLITGTLKAFVNRYKNSDSEEKAFVVTVLTALLVIGTGSIIDFSMTYGAIALLFWTLLGILREEQPANVLTKKDVQTRVAKYILSAAALATVLIGLVSFSFLLAIKYEQDSIAMIDKQDFNKRYEYLEKSRVFNPFYADTYVNMAVMELKLYRKNKDKKHLETALNYADKAVKLNKGNINFRAEKINVLFALKEYDKVVAEAEAAFKLDRWSQDAFGLLAYSYVSAGAEALKAGDKGKAEEYLTKASMVPILLKKNMDTLSVEEKRFLWVGEKPVFNKELQRNVAKALTLKKRL